jgi:hypothetical protein
MTQKKGFVDIDDFVKQFDRPKRTLKVTQIDISENGTLQLRGTYNKPTISGYF